MQEKPEHHRCRELLSGMGVHLVEDDLGAFFIEFEQAWRWHVSEEHTNAKSVE